MEKPINKLSTNYPKCIECGYIHPPHSSGKCPVKHPEVEKPSPPPKTSGEAVPIDFDVFVYKFKSFIEQQDSQKSKSILEGLSKIFNL